MADDANPPPVPKFRRYDGPEWKAADPNSKIQVEDPRDSFKNGVNNATSGLFGSFFQWLGGKLNPQNPVRANALGSIGRTAGEMASAAGETINARSGEALEPTTEKQRRNAEIDNNEPINERLRGSGPQTPENSEAEQGEREPGMSEATQNDVKTKDWTPPTLNDGTTPIEPGSNTVHVTPLQFVAPDMSGPSVENAAREQQEQMQVEQRDESLRSQFEAESEAREEQQRDAEQRDAAQQVQYEAEQRDQQSQQAEQSARDQAQGEQQQAEQRDAQVRANEEQRAQAQEDQRAQEDRAEQERQEQDEQREQAQQEQQEQERADKERQEQADQSEREQQQQEQMRQQQMEEQQRMSQPGRPFP